jgi:hypothetical protein
MRLRQPRRHQLAAHVLREHEDSGLPDRGQPRLGERHDLFVIRAILEAGRAGGGGERDAADLALRRPLAARRAEGAVVLDGEYGAARGCGFERDGIHHGVDMEHVRSEASQERIQGHRPRRARLQAGQVVDRGGHAFAQPFDGAGRDVDLVTARGQGARDRQQVAMCAAPVGQPVGQVKDTHGPIIARRPGVLLGPCPAPVPAS